MAINSSVNLVFSAVDRATAVVNAMTRQITAQFSTAQKVVEAFNKRLSGNEDLSAAMTGVQDFGRKLTDALSDPIKKAMEFESVMADIKKVVDFPTPDGLQVLSNTLLDMSKRIPVSADGLGKIAAAGGQLGVAVADLPQFTEIIAKMSTAFDMLPEKAGDSMAKVSNIFKLSMKEMASVGDAVNHLSNISAANAADIVEVLQRTGGSTSLLGFSAQQTAALSAAMLSLGKTPEVAGTAINALSTKLLTAEKGGKEFQKALELLGFNAASLGQTLKTDTQGAVLDFLKSFDKITDPTKKMGVLVDLFGLEYADDIATLTAGMKEYEKSLVNIGDKSSIARVLWDAQKMTNPAEKLAKLTDILGSIDLAKQVAGMTDMKAAAELVAGKMQYAGSMTKEFEARSATAANALQLFKNRINAVSIHLGNLLLPTVTAVLNGMGEYIEKIENFIRANANAFKNLMLGIGIVGGFFIALATLGNTVSAVTSAFAAFQLAIGLVLSPLGLFTAVAIGAGVLIYKNWANVASFFKGFFEGLSHAFAPLSDSFSGLSKAFSPIVEWFKKLFTPLATTNESLKKFYDTGALIGLSLGTSIAAGLSFVIQKVTQFSTFLSSAFSGQNFLSSFAQSIKTGGQAVWNAVLSVFTWVAKLFPHSPAEAGPFSELLVMGMSVLSTFADGITQNARVVWNKVTEVFAQISDYLGTFLSDAFYSLARTSLSVLGNAFLQYITLPLDALNNLSTVLIGSSLFASIRAFFQNSQSLSSAFNNLASSTTAFGVAVAAVRFTFQAIFAGIVQLYQAVTTFNMANLTAWFLHAKQAVLGFKLSSLSVSMGMESIGTALVMLIPFIKTFANTMLSVGKFLFITPIARTIILVQALASSFSLLVNASGFAKGFFGILEPISEKSVNALTRFKNTWTLVFSSTAAAGAEKKMLFSFLTGLLTFIRQLGAVRFGVLAVTLGLVGSALSKIGIDFSAVAEAIRNAVIKGLLVAVTYLRDFFIWINQKPQGFELTIWQNIVKFFTDVGTSITNVFTAARDVLAEVFKEIGAQGGEIAKQFAPVGAALGAMWVWLRKATDIKNLNAFINVLKSSGFIAKAVTISASAMGLATYAVINYSGAIVQGFDTAIRGIFDFLLWFDTLPPNVQKTMTLVASVIGVGVAAIVAKMMFARRQNPLELILQQLKRMCDMNTCNAAQNKVGIFSRLWAVLRTGLGLPLLVASGFAKAGGAVLNYISVIMRLQRIQAAGKAVDNLPWITRLGLGFANLVSKINSGVIVALSRLSSMLVGLPFIGPWFARMAAAMSSLATLIMGRVTTAFVGLRTVLATTSAFLAANPFMAAILAVAALGAAAYLIYQNWGPIKAFFADLWGGVTTYFQKFVEWLNSVFPGLGDVVAIPFKAIGELISSTIKNLSTLFTAFMEGNWSGVGTALIKTIVDGVNVVGGMLYDTVIGIFGLVRNLLPFSPAKEGPFSTIDVAGQRLITTIADGAAQMGGYLLDKIKNVFAPVTDFVRSTGLGETITNAVFGDPFANNPLATPPKQQAAPTLGQTVTNAIFGDPFASLPKFATGGLINGAGTATSDSIVAQVSNGEYVIPADIVKKYGTGFFEELRKGNLPAYAMGGGVGANITPDTPTLGLQFLPKVDPQQLQKQLQSAIDANPPVLTPQITAPSAIPDLGLLNTPMMPGASLTPPTVQTPATATGTGKGMVVKNHGAVTDIINQTAEKYGIDKNTFMRFAAVETGNKFNANAFNAGSKAAGLFQFIPSSAKAYGISGRAFDPAANSDAAARMYLSNQKLMRKFGIDTNAANMYLAHQQGVGGLNSIHKAATGQSGLSDRTRRNIFSNVSRDWLPQLQGLNDQQLAQRFLQLWKQKFDAIDVTQATGAAGGQATFAALPTMPVAANPVSPPVASVTPPPPTVTSPPVSAHSTGTGKGMVVKNHGAVTDVINQTAEKYGIDKNTFMRFATIETGNKFDPNAFNKGSKAAGLFQFVPGSAAQYGITGREFDASANADAGARMYLDNRKLLAKAGIQETASNMYLAHQQGAQGLMWLNEVARGERGFTKHYNKKGKMIADERANLMSNSTDSWKQQYAGMSDQQIAQFFLKSWENKVNSIDVSQVTGSGGKPLAPVALPTAATTPSATVPPKLSVPATSPVNTPAPVAAQTPTPMAIPEAMPSVPPVLTPTIEPVVNTNFIDEIQTKLNAISLNDLLKNPKQTISGFVGDIKNTFTQKLSGITDLFKNPMDFLNNPQNSISQLTGQLSSLLPQGLSDKLNLGGIGEKVGGFLGQVGNFTGGLTPSLASGFGGGSIPLPNKAGGGNDLLGMTKGLLGGKTETVSSVAAGAQANPNSGGGKAINITIGDINVSGGGGEGFNPQDIGNQIKKNLETALHDSARGNMFDL